MANPNTKNPIPLQQGEQAAPNLCRMGIQIESEEQDTNQEDYILYNSVLGKVKDLRDFTENQVAQWVGTCWTTHDNIQIKKVGQLFYFLC